MSENPDITSGENRVLEAIRNDIITPTEIAKALDVSTSAVSQQLKRLLEKGLLARKRLGKSIEYSLICQEEDELEGGFERDRMSVERDWQLVRESYEALNRVWSHVLKLDLSPEELKKLKEARNLLEDILHERRLPE